MNPCHYPQVTRPRSRSPSPNVLRRIKDERDSGKAPTVSSGSSERGRKANPQCSRINRFRSSSGSKNHLGYDLENGGQSLPLPLSTCPHRSNIQDDVSIVGEQPESIAISKSDYSDINSTNCDHSSAEPLLTDEPHGLWRKRYRVSSNPNPTDRNRELLHIHENERLTSSTPHMCEAANGRNSYGSINDQLQHVIRDADSSNATGDGDSTVQAENCKCTYQKSCYTPSMVDDLRKRNQLYFMDPITKLLYFHGFPWKMTFQIMKVILLTSQVLTFGSQRENIVEYFERGARSYRHLLLANWDPAFETMPYPPATGQYAVYSIEELSTHLNFAVEQYYKLPETSLASIHHIINDTTWKVEPTTLCYKANSDVNFINDSYIMKGGIIQECFVLEPFGKSGNYTFNIAKFLKENKKTIAYNRTISLTLEMKFRTFHINLVETHYGPTCYKLALKIHYENMDRSGQLLVTLKTYPQEINCEGKLSDQILQETRDRKRKVIIVDSIVISLCVISTVLCARSLSRSNKLRKITANYFHLYQGKPFSFSSHMEYINLWYVAIMCNDIVTIIGSAFKIQLESRKFSITSENYAMCSIFLGIGIFLSYMSILRYLSFFKSYNVLILTLKTSFPHVVRFLVCVICLYTGFLFCGWVVFSPYHIKFRRLSTSSECLFSLVNGDDMFVTFSALTTNSNPIWYFHRIYLYVFISIFIYVVLSVFIAVIMDNYENLKFYYEKGFPDNDIQRFINEEGQLKKEHLFSHVKHGTKCQRVFFCLFPCLACLRRNVGISRSYSRFEVTI